MMTLREKYKELTGEDVVISAKHQMCPDRYFDLNGHRCEKDCAVCWDQEYKGEHIKGTPVFTLKDKYKELTGKDPMTERVDHPCPHHAFETKDDGCLLNCAKCWGREYTGQKILINKAEPDPTQAVTKLEVCISSTTCGIGFGVKNLEDLVSHMIPFLGKAKSIRVYINL